MSLRFFRAIFHSRTTLVRVAEKAFNAHVVPTHINGMIFIKKHVSCGLARLQPVEPQIADPAFEPEPSHSIFLFREGGFRVLTPDTLPKRNGDLCRGRKTGDKKTVALLYFFRDYALNFY